MPLQRPAFNPYAATPWRRAIPILCAVLFVAGASIGFWWTRCVAPARPPIVSRMPLPPANSVQNADAAPSDAVDKQEPIELPAKLIDWDDAMHCPQPISDSILWGRR